jgi:hypothetical protein
VLRIHPLIASYQFSDLFGGKMEDFQEPGEGFLPVEEGEEDLCRALWISVIVQAFIDAKGNSSKSGNHRERKQAFDWLADESPEGEFAVVCDLAGLCHKKTQGRIKSLLASEYETLDFRCLTKAWGKAQTVESRVRFFNRARRNARNRQAAYVKLKEHSLSPASNQTHCESRSG